MVVNFQYRSMRLLRTDEEPMVGEVLMDDSDWAACFKALTEGDADVAVRCRRGGARAFVQYVKAHYIYVKAAGGIVHNAAGERLLMVRNDRYDLPKGKVEEGETLAVAAMRETNEETGLGGLQLGRLIGKTYHIYNLYGGWHFKQTTWYAMQADGRERLVPQTDEGISECRWVAPDEWRRCLEQSYATMRELCRYMSE